ncbi:MAG: cytochrome oxidase subunit III [Chloroflexi bacterium]|nr:cytochrome oxidase subunit III [Chloroflexota bacterium]
MNDDQRDQQLQLWGWGLFVISAGFFLAGSLRNGDWLSFAGSAFFLIACFVFIYQLIQS